MAYFEILWLLQREHTYTYIFIYCTLSKIQILMQSSASLLQLCHCTIRFKLLQ